jgi:hypothetical protein
MDFLQLAGLKKVTDLWCISNPALMMVIRIHQKVERVEPSKPFESRDFGHGRQNLLPDQT